MEDWAARQNFVTWDDQITIMVIFKFKWLRQWFPRKMCFYQNEQNLQKLQNDKFHRKSHLYTLEIWRIVAIWDEGCISNNINEIKVISQPSLVLDPDSNFCRKQNLIFNIVRLMIYMKYMSIQISTTLYIMKITSW